MEKYNGSGSRHTCPACGRAKRFTRYIDTENGRYIADHVGRCDRESSCGYHFKPKEYFVANLNLKEDIFWTSQNLRKPKIQQGIKNLAKLSSLPRVSTRSNFETHIKPNCEARFQTKKPDFIRAEKLLQTLNGYERNSFVQFLLGLFPFEPEDVWKAIGEYLIGTNESGRTIFWQIDQKLKIRTGKAIAYDRETGKRDKQSNPFFLHPKDGFELRQCFFGEHLLRKTPGLPIGIVEAEKSAVIASICKGLFPNLVWLACGGKSNLNAERLVCLGLDREIILFPDADAFEKWQEIALDASKHGLKAVVSDLIEKRATEAEKATGCDLADYLIGEQRKRNDPARREAFKDLIEERFAILTIDGGLSEAEAEATIINSGFYADAVRICGASENV